MWRNESMILVLILKLFHEKFIFNLTWSWEAFGRWKSQLTNVFPLKFRFDWEEEWKFKLPKIWKVPFIAALRVLGQRGVVGVLFFYSRPLFWKYYLLKKKNLAFSQAFTSLWWSSVNSKAPECDFIWNHCCWNTQSPGKGSPTKAVYDKNISGVHISGLEAKLEHGRDWEISCYNRLRLKKLHLMFWCFKRL